MLVSTACSGGPDEEASQEQTSLDAESDAFANSQSPRAAEDQHAANDIELAQGTLRGVKLTADQVAGLTDLHAREPNLSGPEVAQQLGIAWELLTDAESGARASAPERDLSAPAGDRVLGQLGQALREGEDSSIGDCSVIFLRGRDDGAYHFEQQLLGGTSALFGSITISTDGSLAIPDFYDVEGPQQIFEDRLSFTGLFAHATTMDGWMLTDASSFCVGALFAAWR